MSESSSTTSSKRTLEESSPRDAEVHKKVKRTDVSTDAAQVDEKKNQKKLNKKLRKQEKKREQQQVADQTTPATSRPAAAAAASSTSSEPTMPVTNTPIDTSKPLFPYKTDDLDHAETPFEAYQDIAPILKHLCHALGKTPKTLKIYDPYYCGGKVKTHMSALGYDNCYNEKEDFYAFAESGSSKGPGDYDVLMTNPPYSVSHVERLFKYCIKSKKPYLLLLPHFFYTESYYKPTIGADVSNLFFICPGLQRGRYGYTPPQWAGVERGGEDGSSSSSSSTAIAPFPTFWYCNAGSNTKQVLKKWSKGNATMTTTASSSSGDGGATSSRLELFQSHVFLARTTSDLPNEFKSEFDLQRKRANPKARKKMAAKRQEMSGGEVFEKKVPSKKAAEWRQKAQTQMKEAKLNK
jgi:hypothetical protein